MHSILQFWGPAMVSGLLFVAAILIGLMVHFISFQALRRIAKRTATVLDGSLYTHCRAPLRILMPLIALRISVPMHTALISEDALYYLGKTLSTLLIISAAWLLIRLTNVFEDFILDRYKVDVSDNLSARKVLTQMDIVRKILIFVIILVTLAMVLMSFDSFRQIGTSLLASAGVAGLVIGFAAQRTIANMLAGFQIAMTQPIRIDDVLIVENEWGRVEEITLTYVVVAIWDLRRLILPISYFIEKPFQNWTRVSADILGTVFLYVDYSVPIDRVRQQLGKIVEASEYYDGKVWRLHTTEAKEHTVELRALMSARNSSDAWELRCEVREKLIEFMQAHYPECLPRFRTEIWGPDAAQLEQGKPVK